MIFRHRQDIYPVSAISLGLILGLLPFAFGWSWWSCSLAALGLLGRALAPIHQHYHSHRVTFRRDWANHLYDFILGLAGGNPTQIWRLHHCLGHHKDYLDPKTDLEGNQRFGTGRWSQELFTVLGDGRSLFDSWILAGKRLKGRARTQARARLVGECCLLAGAMLALLILDVRATLLFILLPNLFLRWAVFWFSYRQHDGATMTNVYDSSVTNFRNNRYLLNVGLHTAHHKWPTAHWSLLEKRTQEILPLIPKDLLRHRPTPMATQAARKHRPPTGISKAKGLAPVNTYK